MIDQKKDDIWKLWLSIFIGAFVLSLILFTLRKTFMSFVIFLTSMPYLGLALHLSNLSKNKLKIINIILIYFLNPLLTTLIGTFVLLGIQYKFHQGLINIYLFSINFFIINIFIYTLLNKHKTKLKKQ
jgi:hypothetical protein